MSRSKFRLAPLIAAFFAIVGLAACGGGGGNGTRPSGPGDEVVITPPSTSPDLAVGTPSASDASPAAGASFTLSATVRNAGDGRSAATTLRYYRSSDATISASDTAVGTDAVGALAASGTSAESVRLTAPSSAGTYYYGACVDTVTGESDTANNCSSAVRVTVSASGGGNSFGVGASLPGVPTSGSFIPARLSGGASLSSSGGTTTVTFGNGGVMQLQDGTVYTCRASGGCQVRNGVVTRGTIESGTGTPPPPPSGVPDLVVGSPSVSDSSPAAGASFTLSATVRNAGDGRSAATTLRYYRSSDATISASDTAVGTDAVGALAASGTSAESVRLTAPSSAGTYYYGACVDTVTGESDTANNCSSGVRVTVSSDPAAAPDLVVTFAVSDRTPNAGDTVELRATVRNAGKGRSAATTLRYYRSSDAIITTSDFEWGTDAVSSLAASDTSSELGLLSVGPSSDYYWGACVDTVSGESDTANNCSSGVRVTVSTAREAVSGTVTSCSGSRDSFTGLVTVSISGTVSAHRSVSFLTATGYANGQFVGIDNVGSLSAGQSRSFGMVGFLTSSGSNIRCNVSLDWTEFSS